MQLDKGSGLRTRPQSPSAAMARDVTAVVSKKHDGPSDIVRSNSHNNVISSSSGGWLVGMSRTKLVFLAVLGSGVLLVFFNMLTIGNSDFDGHLIVKDKFTVLINTFKRPDMMKAAVAHYAACPYVGEVYVTWSEEGPPPAALVKNYEAHKNPKIGFIVHKTDSLNNRFKPLDGYTHHDGIFSVDDDIRVPCQELGMAFEVWRNSQHTLVGFIPRIHIRSRVTGGLMYKCWWNVWYYGAYSMILSKAAFLHHKYLDIYTNTMPESVRKYVHEGRNCEDIAMQFLVANVTSLPPIYVKGHLGDLGVLNGISTSQNFVKATHMDQRSDCLDDLTKLFGRMPLVKSHTIVDAASNGWTSAPATWYEYISSDLWHWN